MALRREQYRRYLSVVAAPAVGVELDVTPTGMGDWRIQAIIFTLTTSAVAGTRAVQLSATDGTTEWWRSPVVAEVPPSTVQQFVSHPGIVGGGSAGGEVARQVSNVFAAAGSVAVGLGAGDALTGFTVCMQAIAAAVAFDVVITNVLGGTMTFRLTAPALGKDIHVVFPDALPAATGLVAPTVTVTGGAGSPAGSVHVYGRAGSLDTVISQAMPDEGVFLRQGWHLRTVTAARDAGDAYTSIAVIVEEYPSGPDYSSSPAQPFVTVPLDS